MEIVNFTPYSAIAGGILIGLAASIMLLLSGRLAGVSGILAGVLIPKKGDISWRLYFLFGLVGGAWLYRVFSGQNSESILYEASAPLIIAGGILVGFGTKLGGGCTSGHGVCGIGRLSTRSIVATLMFIIAGALAVYILRHGLAG